MFKLVIFAAFIAVASAGVIAPVPVVHAVHPVAVSHSSSIVHHTPVVHAPLLHAPLVHAPVVHAAPVIPVVRHSPYIHHAPVIAVHH